MQNLVKLWRLAILVAIVPILLVAIAGCGGNSTASITKVEWVQVWDSAKEQATSAGKPIMINFYGKP